MNILLWTKSFASGMRRERCYAARSAANISCICFRQHVDSLCWHSSQCCAAEAVSKAGLPWPDRIKCHCVRQQPLSLTNYVRRNDDYYASPYGCQLLFRPFVPNQSHAHWHFLAKAILQWARSCCCNARVNFRLPEAYCTIICWILWTNTINDCWLHEAKGAGTCPLNMEFEFLQNCQ